MNAFLWVVLILYSVDVTAKLILLGVRGSATTTPASLAADTALGLIVIVWASVLLFGGGE